MSREEKGDGYFLVAEFVWGPPGKGGSPLPAVLGGQSEETVNDPCFGGGVVHLARQPPSLAWWLFCWLLMEVGGFKEEKLERS